jgi:hypothetical protein
MSRLLAALFLPLLMVFLCVPAVLASQGVGQSAYQFDPLLCLTEPPEVTPAVGSPVVIEAGAHETKVRFNSAMPLAPYVGAEHAAELSLDELLLLPDQQDGGNVKDYQVEAGIGFYLEDKASVSLGYRFNELPAFPGDRSNDPLTLSGDLRISFDVKMAF